jgi:serine/threonine kinase 32
MELSITAPYIPKDDEIVSIANENRKDSVNEVDPESVMSLRRNSV